MLEIAVFSSLPQKSESITSSIFKIVWQNFARLLPNYSALFSANFVQIGWDLAIYFITKRVQGCSVFLGHAVFVESLRYQKLETAWPYGH